MVMKKIDSRIRTVIENGVENGHRSFFLIVGDKAKDQVVILHNILSKAQIKARPSVLWCYKKELGFNNNRKKRLRRIQKKISSGINVSSDNPFDIFIESTKIRFTYYKETTNILGNTFGMLVLQDFEALTPNILARTIETIEGGGIICILLSSLTSLQQLYTLTMDVHRRYVTESHQEISARFNERFILSLSKCSSCLIVDDQLNVLPVFSKNLSIEKVKKKTLDQDANENAKQLKDMCISFQDTQPLGILLGCCKTLDQGNILCKCVEVVSSQTKHGVVSITAARGRGKSALMGLLIASAVALGVSSIFVTAPSLENLITLFEFVISGLKALGYSENLNFEITTCDIDHRKHVSRINIFKNHRQYIQYVEPSNYKIICNAEIVVCDEAAAIPLPMVKNFIGPHLLFLSSTINGYEGTGRSLSLKLIQDLRNNVVTSTSVTPHPTLNSNSSNSYLKEFTLTESIRYSEHDPVEEWLNKFLCLDVNDTFKKHENLVSPPSQCELFYVSRDTLFSYHKAAERFLQKMVSIYVASHYKNSPNDLQMIGDAPAHHLFVLTPSNKNSKELIPSILCVIQVCLEGNIANDSIQQCLGRGQRASGDLIPWTVSQQFCENDFASLNGLRVVRVAVHPDYMGLGYGTRAMNLLFEYYSGKFCQSMTTSLPVTSNRDDKDHSSSESMVKPRVDLPPLLVSLGDRPHESLDYIGVSFGLTVNLLKFWKRLKFVPLYLRQTTNELTGEYTCIMVRSVENDRSVLTPNWLGSFYEDFRNRFMSLLSISFRDLSPSLALSLLYNDEVNIEKKFLELDDLNLLFLPHDLQRLKLYSNNLVDFHLIMDLVPKIAPLYFNNRLDFPQTNWIQAVILVALGLQHKSIDEAEKHINMPASQLLALLNKLIIKISTFFDKIKFDSLQSSYSGEKRKKNTENGNDSKHVLPSDSHSHSSHHDQPDESSVNTSKSKPLPSNLLKFSVPSDPKVWKDVLQQKSASTGVSIPRKVKKQE